MSSWQEMLVRGTAWVSCFCYLMALALWIMLPHRPRRARFWYTAGWWILLIHVGLAFQFYHAWSHQRAWRQTELQSGYGNGIYANYGLLVIWGCDVAWAWLLPRNYQLRSQWFGWIIQGFLLLMWFCAATLFALWPTLFLGWGLFAAFAGLVLVTKWLNGKG
jgi:hypothetical protein